MKTLESKVAVVTGGSRGIGRAIGARLARDGAAVCLVYRGDAGAARSAVAEIEADGGEAFSLQLDVGAVAEIAPFFERLDAELSARKGDRGFDILVNNAGISGPSAVDDFSEGEFDRVFATNVKGPFFLVQHALPRLREGGRIINVSSGLSRKPIPPYLGYSMTKGALDNFTLGLALQLGSRQITVNTLAPGLTETDMNARIRENPEAAAPFISKTPLGRLGRPDDIADAAAFLASDDSRWVTGQYLEAGGGLGLGLGL